MAEIEVAQKCEVEGCDWEGTPCFYPDNPIYDWDEDEGDEDAPEWDGVPDHHFCAKHAHKHGFCFGCGEFWGGVESFDFGRGAHSGLCENCRANSDFEDEQEDYDDDDDGYGFNEGY